MNNDATIFMKFNPGEWKYAEAKLNAALSGLNNISAGAIDIKIENNILYVFITIENRQTNPRRLYAKHFIFDEQTNPTSIHLEIQTFLDSPFSATEEIYFMCQDFDISEISQQFIYLYYPGAH